jgi:hypothetical protein
MRPLASIVGPIANGNRNTGAAPPPTGVDELLLHLNGIDGGTVFTDNGSHGYTDIHRNGTGNVVTSTAQSQFGGSSMYIPTGYDWLTVNTPETTIGTSDFSMDFWTRPSAEGSEIYCALNSGANDTGWIILLFANSGQMTFYDGGVPGATPLGPVNTWTHFECTRNSGVVYMFTNGVLSTPFSYARDFGATIGSVTVGNCPAFGVRAAVGYMQEFHLLTGMGCGHTANFMPPTSPYPS